MPGSGVSTETLIHFRIRRTDGHREIEDQMQTLLLFGLAGFLAQLVDGSLGMAFGVTATTTLVAVGTVPAVASAAVHLAEVGTALASGVAHWRFRNIDWRTVGILAAPGAVGAVLGAYVLTSLPMGFAEVWITLVLLLLGCYVLVRFAFFHKPGALVGARRPSTRFLGPLGLVAGFVDASGGGGWGPVATTTLLSSGRLEPRKVIGSVDTSEFLVALAASLGFLFSLSQEDQLNYTVVAGLMLGGVVAAPLAAWLVRRLPPRVLGAAAGGLIVFTNARTLLNAVGASPSVKTVVLSALAVLWGVGLASAVRSARAERRSDTSAYGHDQDGNSAIHFLRVVPDELPVAGSSSPGEEFFPLPGKRWEPRFRRLFEGKRRRHVRPRSTTRTTGSFKRRAETFLHRVPGLHDLATFGFHGFRVGPIPLERQQQLHHPAHHVGMPQRHRRLHTNGRVGVPADERRHAHPLRDQLLP